VEAVHQAHGGGDEAALGERVEVGQDAAVLGSTETRRPDSKSSATITPWVRYSACGGELGVVPGHDLRHLVERHRRQPGGPVGLGCWARTISSCHSSGIPEVQMTSSTSPSARAVQRGQRQDLGLPNKYCV
jgi:hypothetical protein